MDYKRRRPMPWYPGPKLGPFQFPTESHGSRIKFIEKLGYGLHSSVCRVEIAGKTYALKIFLFQHWSDLAHPDKLKYLSVDDVYGQYDPFNCECRAYGRLQEAGAEDLAAKCYGYVILSAEEEAQVTSLWHMDWNRRPQNRRQGLRALLKEYVPTKQHYDVERLPEMREDLLHLHQLGIVVFDLREGNYLDSKLVDFSQAHVAPHNELDMVNNPGITRQVCWKDYMGFDGMARSIDLRHPCAFFPSPISSRKLRSAAVDKKQRSAGGMDEKYLIAARYDWQKAKKLATIKTKGNPSMQPANAPKGRISKAATSPKKKLSRKMGRK